MWANFTEGEGDGYGGPLAVLFDESPASAAKDVMRKVQPLRKTLAVCGLAVCNLACMSH